MLIRRTAARHRFPAWSAPPEETLHLLTPPPTAPPPRTPGATGRRQGGTRP
jgi:hypothetical protein